MSNDRGAKRWIRHAREGAQCGVRQSKGNERGLCIAFVPFDPAIDQLLEERAIAFGQDALVTQHLTKRPLLMDGPRVHTGHELVCRDAVRMESEDSEDQVAIG
jgi:hypothetical protein